MVLVGARLERLILKHPSVGGWACALAYGSRAALAGSAQEHDLCKVMWERFLTPRVGQSWSMTGKLKVRTPIALGFLRGAATDSLIVPREAGWLHFDIRCHTAKTIATTIATAIVGIEMPLHAAPLSSL